jgi:acyl-CoA reductase-like NAD-dependent aldehyde dehydrogenase
MTRQAVRADTIAVHNPADGTVVGRVDEHSPHDVEACVARVRAAQPAWEALGAQGRSAWMQRYRDWLLDHHTELSELLQRETAKPRQEATFEVPFALEVLNYYVRNAARFLADEHPRPHGLLTAARKLTVSRRPYPVVGVICPWNFPMMIGLGDAIPALLAGMAVVLKPSEHTPLATRRAIEGWTRSARPTCSPASPRRCLYTGRGRSAPTLARWSPIPKKHPTSRRSAKCGEYSSTPNPLSEGNSTTGSRSSTNPSPAIAGYGP